MSVHNIERKGKLLETNLKSEEIINLYFCISWHLYGDFFQKNCNDCFVFTNFTSRW